MNNKPPDEIELKYIQEIENSKKKLALKILEKINIEPKLLAHILKELQISNDEFKNYISFKESQNISFYYEIINIIKEYNTK